MMFSPFHRITERRFWNIGILLPWESEEEVEQLTYQIRKLLLQCLESMKTPSCYTHWLSNCSTLYTSHHAYTINQWLPFNTASLLRIFDTQVVLEAGKKLSVAENDIHGGLFHTLKAKVDAFCRRITSLNVTFSIYPGGCKGPSWWAPNPGST